MSGTNHVFNITAIPSGVYRFIKEGRMAWPPGILFGSGGFIGTYLGARAQKFVPQRIIKLIIAVVIVFLAIRYIVQFF